MDLINRFVHVILSYAPGCAYLTVKDSGVGIPASDIDLIGDRFHRVQSISRSHEGTGIGISLIKVSCLSPRVERGGADRV
jgi:signal transduction histidine kinase